MSAELDSFVASPPEVTINGKRVRLRAMNRSFARLIEAVEKITEPEKVGPALVLAFIVFASVDPYEAAEILTDLERLEKEIIAADIEVSDEDARAVDAYLSGVIQRWEAAAFVIENGPGKPKGTRQATRQRKSTSSRTNTGGHQR